MKIKEKGLMLLVSVCLLLIGDSYVTAQKLDEIFENLAVAKDSTYTLNDFNSPFFWKRPPKGKYNKTRLRFST